MNVARVLGLANLVRKQASGRCKPLYNPGGPCSYPAPGVRYGAPSPPIAEHAMIAADNPLTVTYRPRS